MVPLLLLLPRPYLRSIHREVGALRLGCLSFIYLKLEFLITIENLLSITIPPPPKETKRIREKTKI